MVSFGKQEWLPVCSPGETYSLHISLEVRWQMITTGKGNSACSEDLMNQSRGGGLFWERKPEAYFRPKAEMLLNNVHAHIHTDRNMLQHSKRKKIRDSH